MEKISHYCQKCRTANIPGELNCRHCGTRLMIVTLPPSLHLEQEIIPSYYEDHLLERVTLLELRLSQITEQLAMANEFISRQNESFEQDHLVIQSFMETIKEINPEVADGLSEKFVSNYDFIKKRSENSDRDQRIIAEIQLNHKNSNIELFLHLLEEGLSLLEKKEEKQGFRTLERAVLLSPENVPLLIFISEKLFVTDRYDLAKKYLNKIYQLAPQEINAILLLGVIYAEEGDAQTSRKFLSVLAGNPKTKVCANLIWGVLAAFEGNWTESLVAFKEAINENEESEIYYLIGCCYFQIKEYDKALSYLENAIKIDEKFADAWFMQSVIYSSKNQIGQANKTKFMAFESKEAGAKCLNFYKHKDLSNIETALPFLHFGELNKKLITNSSVRLNNFFRSKVFKALK